MPKLRPLPEAPPTARGNNPPMKKFNWEAIAMAARLVADEPVERDRWISVGHDILRAHANQINGGHKKALRPRGHYKAISRAGGRNNNYGHVMVTYRGPRLPGDSQIALRRLIDANPQYSGVALERDAE